MSPGPAFLAWRFHPRVARGYDAAIRILGGAWFLLLAFAVALKTVTHAQSTFIDDFSPTALAAALSGACLFLFYLVLFWAMLVRPPAKERFNGLPCSIIAFAGSYLPWIIIAFKSGETSASQSVASAALLLIGTVSMVVVILHLGLSFSIVPQARTLVRTGKPTVSCRGSRTAGNVASILFATDVDIVLGSRRTPGPADAL